MKTLRWILLFAVIVFNGAGCDVCDPLGPPCATMSIGASKEGEGLLGDALVVNINEEAQADRLTDAVPVRTYRVEIQTERRRGYQIRDDGMVYVSALSVNLGVLSRTKRRKAYTDRLTHFEFRISDFRLLSLTAMSTSNAVMVLIEGDNEKLVRLDSDETQEVWVDWEDEYRLRIYDLHTGEVRHKTFRPGEDEAKPVFEFR